MLCLTVISSPIEQAPQMFNRSAAANLAACKTLARRLRLCTGGFSRYCRIQTIFRPRQTPCVLATMPEHDESDPLQPKKTTSLGRLAAAAAAFSFLLGAAAATAVRGSGLRGSDLHETVETRSSVSYLRAVKSTLVSTSFSWSSASAIAAVNVTRRLMW